MAELGPAPGYNAFEMVAAFRTLGVSIIRIT